uniref:Uncharacterized protein n=1 Tax=Pithovirus LCPAC404 TaxID=2506597 RepID=A0A481ZCK0_9VIRU|nr:MAG: hypothetical protein LCPAC404_01000 [Pithovirus LCPAC404]
MSNDATVRCSEITLKDLQCKNEARDGNEKCYLHLGERKTGNNLTCSGTTSKGDKCMKRVKSKGIMCHLHLKQLDVETDEVNEDVDDCITQLQTIKLMELLAQVTDFDFDDTLSVVFQYQDLIDHTSSMI